MTKITREFCIHRAALLVELRATNMYDDARFARALRDASAFAKVSESDLAEMLGVSRPTILLWKSGVSKPHRAIRETVKQVLVNIVEEMGDDE